jgi:hypothetical protein
MHPNAYLRTLWRLELRPSVFVAMSFAPQFADCVHHAKVPRGLS